MKKARKIYADKYKPEVAVFCKQALETIFTELKESEDERLCNCLIREQEKALDGVKNDKYGHSEIISDLKEMYDERINWLKSLKDRVEKIKEITEND